MRKNEIYSRLKDAQKQGESGATCNTAAYAAGIARRELIHITKSKMFSGANQLRFIYGTERRYEGEAENAWNRGVNLIKRLGITQKRKNWNDLPEEDLTDLSQNIEPSGDKIRDSVSYLPIKADVEFAESQLRKSSEEVIDIENVLDQLELNFNKILKPLKENWREITRRNIRIWFGKII